MGQKKVVYISGPITGVDRYWEAFEQAEDDLSALGYIPLSPARLPGGMTNEQYMRIDMSMIDSADAVLFLPGSLNSAGARLELKYCKYTGKPYTRYKTREPFQDCRCSRGATLEMLRKDLEEVLSK